jgi:hypothetical protein
MPFGRLPAADSIAAGAFGGVEELVGLLQQLGNKVPSTFRSAQA